MVVPAVMLLIVGAYHAWLWWAVLDFLPRDIGVRWVKEITIEPGFPTSWITTTAGYVLYELDEATVEKLESGGLSSLRGALVPRGADQTEQRRHYLPWAGTPFPAAWTVYTPEAGGLWSGLAFSQFSPGFERRLVASVREPGSFYTFNGHGDMLVVIPKLHIAVLTWWH